MSGLTKENMKANGNTTKWMVSEKLCGMMVRYMKAITLTIKNKERDYFAGKTNAVMTVNGNQGNSMELENLLLN